MPFSITTLSIITFILMTFSMKGLFGTFSIVPFSIMPFIMMTLSKITFSLITFRIISDIQNNVSKMPFSTTTLIITIFGLMTLATEGLFGTFSIVPFIILPSSITTFSTTMICHNADCNEAPLLTRCQHLSRF
jgi:hypothetical protein